MCHSDRSAVGALAEESIYMKKITILILIFLFSLSAYAAERTFKAELSRGHTSPGRQVELSLIFSHTKDIPPPDMPFMPGITFRYKGKEEGAFDEILIYKFAIIPSTVGTFSIGPLYTAYNGDFYVSNKIELKVDKSFETQNVPIEKVKTESRDLSKHVFVDMEVSADEVYVNEKVLIKLRIFSDWLDIENLKIVELLQNNDFIGAKIDKTNSFFKEIKGVKYFVIEYSKEIFSPYSGKFMLSPFEARFNIIMAKKENGVYAELLNDNMNYYEKYLGKKKERKEVLKTQPIKINVLALPEKKPLGYKGAVGDFSVEIKENWSSFEINKILKFTTIVEGKGNYDTVSSPEFVSKKGIKIYPENKYKKEKSVIFEQAIKVEDAELAQIPPLRFVFFSPAKKSYELVQKGPFELDVMGGGKIVESIGGIDDGVIEKKQDWVMVLKHSPENRSSDNYGMFPLVIIFGVFCFEILIFIVALYKYRIDWIRRSDDPKAVFLRTKYISRDLLLRAGGFYRKGKSEAFCGIIFQGLQDYFGSLLGLSSGNITESVVGRVLKETYQVESLSDGINEVFLYCYRGKFSDSTLDKSEMKRALVKTESLLKLFNEVGLEIIKTRTSEKI